MKNIFEKIIFQKKLDIFIHVYIYGICFWEIVPPPRSASVQKQMSHKTHVAMPAVARMWHT